jgi:hypothetical protein
MNITKYPYTTSDGEASASSLEEHLFGLANSPFKVLVFKRPTPPEGWTYLPIAVLFPDLHDYENLMDNPEEHYKEAEQTLNQELRDEGSKFYVRLKPVGHGQGIMYKLLPIDRIGGEKRSGLLRV